ncbi:pentapeptide repeat-containing protein [Labrenzia sp. 5N]|uniref:pentapeptide repeat-containing protein n=1 Tax=Labrenzia sp. 5N TaxID=2723402 RepID=UPI001447AE1E|nr:pentapeptide repeat-containing protein [Labrenzia sp. 5N]NKX67014.1 pentapeptide repeat-containing protein [Labrenzia sp. 5N]
MGLISWLLGMDRPRLRWWLAALAVMAVLIGVSPFLWVLCLHAYHIVIEAFSKGPAHYLQEIAAQPDNEFFANVRNLGLIALGIIGTALALWRSVLAHRAHRLSEKGLNLDRYQKGAQMLESLDLSVRFAGIYALRDLAISDPDESYSLVLDLLFDFVRERSKVRVKSVSPVPVHPKVYYAPFPADLQKALEVVSSLRRTLPNARSLERGCLLDLRNANLFGADLAGLYMPKVKLLHAQMSGANLKGANLKGASLPVANLSGAILDGADLSKTNLTGSSLVRAHLFYANLSGATLTGADLSRAILSGARLSETNLTGTNLSGADVSSPDIDITNAWAVRINPPKGVSEKIMEGLTLRNENELRAEHLKRLLAAENRKGSWTERLRKRDPNI